jgi:hypothetical protein
MVPHMHYPYRNLLKPADPAASLRMRMAQHAVSVEEVCQLVERKRDCVSRWRRGLTVIPVEPARKLHAAGLLDTEALNAIEARQ